MFAVIVYFWNGWKRDYFSTSGKLQWFAIQIIIATICTGIVGYGLKEVIEKIFMRGVPHAEVEDLFNNLPLIAGALAAVGVLIIYAGWREEKIPRHSEIQPAQSIWIGIVQGICLPFRGFSRSGSTISTGLLLGLPKQKLEEFSFALAVVLTPPIIAKEAKRLLQEHTLNGYDSALHLFLPGVVGMIFSFAAGLLALKWLSRWLEGGRWKFFGFYCLIAAAGVLIIHLTLPR
jgi:undecaprenyl-diphosphatase